MSSPDDIFGRTLEQAQVVREHAITSNATGAENADRVATRAFSSEGLLAQEVIRLARRIEWLDRHPKLRRYIGRSAVSIERIRGERYGSISWLSTPVILEAERRADGPHILRSGTMFSKLCLPYYGGYDAIYADEAVEDMLTGVRQKGNHTALQPYDSPTGLRVQVRNSTFESFAYGRQAEAWKRFRAEYPWSEGQYYGLDVRNFSSGQPYVDFDLAGARVEDSNYAERDRQIEVIRTELAPHLLPGYSWEFPDEMFLAPLALVSAANDALGRRRQH